MPSWYGRRTTGRTVAGLCASSPRTGNQCQSAQVSEGVRKGKTRHLEVVAGRKQRSCAYLPTAGRLTLSFDWVSSLTSSSRLLSLSNWRNSASERQAEDLTEEGRTPCSHLVRYSRLAQAPTCRNWHAQYWLDTNWHAASGTRSSPRSNLHRKLPRPLRWCLATFEPIPSRSAANRSICREGQMFSEFPPRPSTVALAVAGAWCRVPRRLSIGVVELARSSVRNSRPNAQTLPWATWPLR